MAGMEKIHREYRIKKHAMRMMMGIGETSEVSKIMVGRCKKLVGRT